MRARHPGRRNLAKALLAAGTTLLLAACGTTSREDFPQDALSPDGPIARMQDDLWQIVFFIAVLIFILVQGLIIVAMVRFRARKTDTELPRQIHGNTKLEILWTAIPALILVGVAVPTVQTIFEVAEEAPEGERVDVRVVGKQYWWQFEYPGTDVLTANEMVIPAGTPIHVELDGIGIYEDAAGNEARDTNLVLHSFWVPRLAGKLDYVPGHERFLRIEADEPGVYRGQCAEFCGLSHANMRFYVTALEPAEYEEWLTQQEEEARQPEGGQEQEGYELFAQNCVACHQIRGHEANGGSRIGPDLTHFASREQFAGAIFDNEDTEQLKRWIQNSQREKPGSQMLPFPNLTEDELDALAAYLQSLE